LSRFVVNRKIRLRVGFLFGIAYLVFARPGSLLWLGLAVAFVGLLIRAWAAGHIVKNEQLTTTGPYSHSRNPLYFGSFVLAAGFALAAHWSLLLVVAALFAFIYGPTIEQERTEIRRRFPDTYPDFEANVPAFVPRLTPWRRQTAAESFSFSRYMRQREWQAGLAFVVVSAWLVARSRTGF
jgi:protein-S-isoprenylcysteine O-methyltransferase Ste14